MRELTAEELAFVAGGEEQMTCTPTTAANDYYGVQNPTSVGDDLINIYEGLVAATSHIIERVALALD
jgi:hypothetical protein